MKTQPHVWPLVALILKESPEGWWTQEVFLSEVKAFSTEEALQKGKLQYPGLAPRLAVVALPPKERN